MNREDAAKIPIIAMTANAFEEDIRRALQSGINAHIKKPIAPEHLIHVMKYHFQIE
jgi:CheY-like chemotaxis protein